MRDLLTSRSSIGDMTKAASDCGLFHQFTLPATNLRNKYIELPLERPLSLEVGKDGIIGRRVSMFSRRESGPDIVLAEGIVGYNFLEHRSAL